MKDSLKLLALLSVLTTSANGNAAIKPVHIAELSARIIALKLKQQPLTASEKELKQMLQYRLTQIITK